MVGADKEVSYVEIQTICLRSKNRDDTTTLIKNEIITGNTIYIDFALEDDQVVQGANEITLGAFETSKNPNTLKQDTRWIKEKKVYITYNTWCVSSIFRLQKL